MHRYAVVDIETTGLFHQGHGITEIAVVHLDNGSASLAFHSLFNPMREVPIGVTRITGIDSALTYRAPSFSEKAQDLLAALEGRIFVAHQVNFDYAFIKKAFELIGVPFKAKRICTLRIAKRAFPGLKRYNLQALCKHFSIENTAPHRAAGDAMAAAKLFMHLHSLDGGKLIDQELSRNSRGAVLPAHLSRDIVDDLPSQSGVYHFYGRYAIQPLYVGKALNIRKRVMSHFTGPAESRRKQLFQKEIHDLKFFVTGSSYSASLREDADIRSLQPRYNIAQRNASAALAIQFYKVRGGGTRLALVPAKTHHLTFEKFGSKTEFRQWLYDQSKAFGFSTARAGMAECGGHHVLGTDEEEAAFAAFEASLKGQCHEQQNALTALLEPATEFGLQPYALLRQNHYLGYGFIPQGTSVTEQSIITALTPAPESATVRQILRQMLNDHHIQKIAVT